jgi:hypothetical protein
MGATLRSGRSCIGNALWLVDDRYVYRQHASLPLPEGWGEYGDGLISPPGAKRQGGAPATEEPGGGLALTNGDCAPSPRRPLPPTSARLSASAGTFLPQAGGQWGGQEPFPHSTSSLGEQLREPSTRKREDSRSLRSLSAGGCGYDS